MKRKVDQGETQRAYVHALSDSGSHIHEKERRPGRTPKRFATAEHLHCCSLPAAPVGFRQGPEGREKQFTMLKVD